jgi:hypothetical protein
MNNNIHFSEGNIKSRSTDDIIFLTWSLPSKITCPYATELCKKKCFAKKNETFEGVRNSRHRNLEETRKDTFVSDVIEILNYNLNRTKAKNKITYVRIHTSGDFYNTDYLDKWVGIAEHFKSNQKILFQAYTKSMPILNEYLTTNNKVLSDINIHFVWSIWYDTKEEYTKTAYKLGMQTFTALPKTDIQAAVDNGSFLCNGDCGNCRECYTGKSNSIVIPYH